MNDLNTTHTIQPQSMDTYSGPVDEEEIDLAKYFGVLLAYKWFIGLVVFIGILLGGSYAAITTPIYQTNVLIQIEDQQASSLAALENVAGMFEGDATTGAEIELLRSRMVIKEAVDQLSLNIFVEPEYFPLVGRAMARYFTPQQSGVVEPWFDQPQYAWGGEKIVVDFFEMPDTLLGKSLQLIAGPSGKYRLLDQHQQLLLEGKVGKLAEVSEGKDGKIKLFVSVLKARSGTHFQLIRFSPIRSIKRVLGDFSVQEKSTNSGILNLTMVGPDKVVITQLLNKIADVYVAQNIARSSAEAELSLNFLEKQLPPLKERVNAAENSYNEYRIQNSSVNLAGETKAVLEGLAQIEVALLNLRQERGELRKRFKVIHPVIKALDSKISILKAQGEKFEKDADQLPETQRDILRLARDVEVNTGLYTKLLNTAQELNMVKAGTVGNIRIIDYALIPETPVKPQKRLIVVFAFFFALFLGIILALLLRALRGGVNDPDEIERRLGLPVYASVIHSKAQRRMMKRAEKDGRAIGILARRQPDDSAIESLRSLRTTLYFSLKQADNNIVMVAGASPKVGKTFTSINLGAVLASDDNKVLVIDADLRRGSLHRYIGRPRNHGLTELITETTEEGIAEYIQSTGVEGLSLLPSGSLPPNPAELLLHESFKQKLEILSGTFDYVIIDVPPILAVTDAAIIGKNAATTLLVVKANFHPMRELEQATRQLQQAGIVIKGVVFNDVKVNNRHYIYQYDYKEVPEKSFGQFLTR